MRGLPPRWARGGSLQGIEPRKGIATTSLTTEARDVFTWLQGIEPRKGIATSLLSRLSYSPMRCCKGLSPVRGLRHFKVKEPRGLGIDWRCKGLSPVRGLRRRGAAAPR